MSRSWISIPVLAAGFLMFSGFMSLAWAAPKKDSEKACVDWCFDNRSGEERAKCLNQCECYYHDNLCKKNNNTSAAPRRDGALAPGAQVSPGTAPPSTTKKKSGEPPKSP